VNVVLDINEFNQDVRTLSAGFAARLPDLIQVAALDGFAKIRNRIQETGTRENGSQLPDYSESYFRNKSERYGVEAASVRNYTATGDMWRNIGITETDPTSAGLTVTVSGETSFAQNKVNWNALRDGDFLAVSEAEELQVAENLQQEIDFFFEQNQ
jgi:hypothetical protein